MAKMREGQARPPLTLVTPRKRSILEFACIVCGAKSSQRDLICAGCGATDTQTAVEHDPGETEGNSGKTYRRALCADAIRSKVPPKIPTGRSAWDIALGGGFSRPSSVLVRGPAGVGKSTSAIRIACHVAERLGGVALYGSAEMPAMHMKKLADELSISKNALRRLYIQDSPEAEDLLEDIEELDPCIIVWDSMQRFRWDGELGERELRRVVTEAIAAGIASSAVTLLISQVTKDDDFVGENGIRHDIDVELSLRKAGENMVGVDCLSKNRFAPTPAGAIEKLYETV